MTVVAVVLSFVALVGAGAGAVWVRVHLPGVIESGDISLYLQHYRVLSALLRPVLTRGRHALSGPTPALPVGGRATTGSASWGWGRVPGGLLADPALLPVAGCVGASAIGVPVPCVPTPVGARGAGFQPPVDHADRSTTVLSRHEPTAIVMVPGGAFIVRPGATVAEFVQGQSGKTPGGANARVSVAGGTRAPGDGPEPADPTGESADATPSDTEGSSRRGGTLPFLAYLFGIERPWWSPPRGWAGVEVAPAAIPAAPVEPVERSALLCSRRRGGPRALAEVPLPRQRTDRRESATVPPARVGAGRPQPPAVGE
jgi:hypothetical protein